MAAGLTPGRRVMPDPDGSFVALVPGDYHLSEFQPGKQSLLYWPAGAEVGPWSANAGKTITVHEDGTISVQPSILCVYAKMVPGKPGQWHGYLERGQWRQA